METSPKTNNKGNKQYAYPSTPSHPLYIKRWCKVVNCGKVRGKKIEENPKRRKRQHASYQISPELFLLVVPWPWRWYIQSQPSHGKP